jgi:hypothetical protein
MFDYWQFSSDASFGTCPERLQASYRRPVRCGKWELGSRGHRLVAVLHVIYPQRWIAERRHACLGGSIQNHKNKDSLYGKKSLESGRIEQIVYKYRASPTVRSIDFTIQCTIPKKFIPQVDTQALALPRN